MRFVWSEFKIYFIRIVFAIVLDYIVWDVLPNRVFCGTRSLSVIEDVALAQCILIYNAEIPNTEVYVHTTNELTQESFSLSSVFWDEYMYIQSFS